MQPPPHPQDLAGKWAVVTGASSGLGADFASLLAARGCSLVLVARRRDRLERLQAELAPTGVRTLLLVLDLARAEAPQELFAFTEGQGLAIDFLLNNAGFGKMAPFLDSSTEEDAGMVHVNVRAVLQLTKLFVRPMLARGYGRILNVASVAAYSPMGNFTAYAASKAYVLSFSEGLNAELLGSDVHVSALCPGMTRTEFFERAGADQEKLKHFGTMPSLPVAQDGVELMLRGGFSHIPGWRNRIMVLASQLFPRSWMARLSRHLLAQS